MQTWTTQYETDARLVEWIQTSPIKDFPSFLIQIFAGQSDPQLLKHIINILHSNLPAAVIIGATTAGEIFNGKMFDGSITISLSAFDAVVLKSSVKTGKDLVSMGKELARDIITEDTKCVIIFADGIKCNGESILQGFNQIATQEIVITGGMAADNYHFSHTFLIHGTDIFEEGVVAVSLSGPALHIFHTYNLGWHPIGREMKVTKAIGNRVYEIDHTPVKEIYATYLGEDIVKGMPDSAIEFPLIFLQNNVNIARSMISVDEDGSILYAGDLPLDINVRFGVVSSSLFNKDTEKTYQLTARMPIEGLFIYSCAGRKAFLGNNLENEFYPLSQIVPASGFFTYGEFYQSDDGGKLLNVTTTILGISESSASTHAIDDELIKNDRYSLSLSALIHLVDITTEDLSRESKEHRNTIAFLNQYTQAIESAFIVSKTDKNGIITYANDHFCAISGYTRQELIGSNHRIIRHPDTPSSTFQDLWATILQKKIWNGAIKNRKKDGSAYYVKSTIIPMLDDDGNIVEYIGLREDITEIEVSRQKAYEAERFKATFMANMSHEIRTPLNGIVGFTHLLSQSDLDVKQRRYLSVIENSIDTLKRIVNDVLDYSKLEEGKMDIELVDINPHAELQDAFELFAPKAQQKNIHYDIVLDQRMHQCLSIDLLRIKQIMINLINNALKFTPINGSVTVRIDVMEDTTAHQELLFSVVDTGIGIAEDKLSTIFETFTQADTSITRQFGGTGLGLSIANAFVILMGGILQVKSTLGSGSTFYFQIKIAKCISSIKAAGNKEDENILSPLSHNKDDLSHLKILVAEDYDTNQMLIDEFLKKFGIKADFADNGKEAIRMVNQKSYDVVLMDANMPVMGGIEATENIRRTHPYLPIIALTANALEGDREKFIKAGMNQYLTKPINTSELYAVLHQYAKDLHRDESDKENRYDQAMSHAMETLHLNESVIKRLFETFLQTLPVEIEHLNDAINNLDFDNIYQIAHKINGASSGLRLDTLHEYAIEIEKNAKNANADYNYREAAKRVETNLNKLRKAVEKDLNG